MDVELYNDVPPDCRAEAMARMAWLVIRGASPYDAFNAALRGMSDDEMVQERLPSWDATQAACAAWPRAGRLADGTPVDGAFQLALAMDSFVAAALEGSDRAEDRAHWLRPLCPNERVVEAAVRWIAARAESLAPVAATEEEEWDGPAAAQAPPEPAPEPAFRAWRTDDDFGFPDE